MNTPFAVVLGAGPGVGAAFARRLLAAGHAVALVARDAAKLSALAGGLAADGGAVRTATADVSDPGQLTKVVEGLAAEAGRLDVLHYNTSRYRAGGVADTTAADLLDDLALGAAGLLTAVRAGLPFLLHGGGTVTATGGGAADRPSPGALTLGVQKAALRALVLGLARELTPQGVHVATVTVRGAIGEHRPALTPDDVASALAGLVQETAGPHEGWATVLDLTRDGLVQLH